MSKFHPHPFALFVCASSALFASGCLLTPAGYDSERRALADAGVAYSEPFEKRTLPPLDGVPSRSALVERACLASAELEAAWNGWRAALARVERASAWPNTNGELDFQRSFGSGPGSAFDRTSFALGFDPMQTLLEPEKLRLAGKVALAQARAAGERVRELAFDLRRRVLSSWSELCLLDERRRITAENAELALLARRSSANMLASGASARDTLRLELEAQLAANELARTSAALAVEHARLDALLGREPGSALELPVLQPAARSVAHDDAELLAQAALHDPELAALARESEGRTAALARTERERVPDLTPRIGFTGSIEQFIGGALSFPLNLAALDAAIEESRANLASARSSARFAKLDRAARFLAHRLLLREAERAERFQTEQLLPLVERAEASARTAYSSGSSTQVEWLGLLGLRLRVRTLLAEARAARDGELAELEALAGVELAPLDPEELSHG